MNCSFAYSHRNVFGRNQKLNISLERGQIDSIFRINYTDPWIEGDDKRTSRTIMVQVISFFYFLSMANTLMTGDWLLHISFFILVFRIQALLEHWFMLKVKVMVAWPLAVWRQVLNSANHSGQSGVERQDLFFRYLW